MENDQNEINGFVQEDESRTPSISILELFCSGWNQYVEFEDPVAQAANYKINIADNDKQMLH